jgi:ERCC4-type nuclease
MSAKNYSTLVIADDRERRSNIIQILSRSSNVSVKIRRLSAGDYLVNNHLVFERKTLNDFALSIIDGRIFRQAISLVNSKYKSIMILEGTGRELSDTGVRREAMQGALITVSIVLGIPVLRSKDPAESARLILYTAKQIKSIVKGPIRRHGWRPKGKRKKQLYILQGLPKVGGGRAARLLDAFGSVEAVMTASIEELQSVEGIGHHTAQRIKWAVSDNIQPYGDVDEMPI